MDGMQINDLHAMTAAATDDGTADPRSRNYQRELIRPKVPWVRIALFIILVTAGAWCSYLLLTAASIPGKIAALICSAAVLVVIFLFLKRILITLVQVYQCFAPDAIRKKCRFEPSCSQYMILSLQKYSLWKGVWKGIHRLWRCHKQDGGFDDP